MMLSIVTTLYKSEPYIGEFYQRITSAAQQTAGTSYEIVFVNDGSPDASLKIALDLQSTDPKIKLVDLSRNFGHHSAIVAGLAHARGERVFLIDCDLEEQPEWLPLFISTMNDRQTDVVFGTQKERISSGHSNFMGNFFWVFMNLVSTVSIPHNPMTCRLMSRRYLDSLLTVGDHVLYLAGVFAWTGYSQSEIPLKKLPRPSGHKSSYSLMRKIMQVVDSISSFSTAPLSLIFLTGLTVWLGSVFYALILLIGKILTPDAIISGFTSLMLSIWFLGGSTILFIGIIGLYVAKIFQEVKRRPLYIVREFYEGKSDDPVS